MGRDGRVITRDLGQHKACNSSYVLCGSSRCCQGGCAFDEAANVTYCDVYPQCGPSGRTIMYCACGEQCFIKWRPPPIYSIFLCCKGASGPVCVADERSSTWLTAIGLAVFAVVAVALTLLYCFKDTIVSHVRSAYHVLRD